MSDLKRDVPGSERDVSPPACPPTGAACPPEGAACPPTRLPDGQAGAACPPEQEPEVRKPSKWHLLRRLYDWVLHWAHTPYGTPALAVLAFTESSFFPVPPDVLLIALAFGRRNRAFYYATICTVFSVLGGMFGYFLGHEFFGVVNYIVAWVVGPGAWYGVFHKGAEVVKFPGFEFEFYRYAAGSAFASDTSVFLRVQALYDANAFLAVFAAAFTPIPYKVFTVAGGYFRISFLTLVVASVLGRGARFFIVGALLYSFGPAVRRMIEKYFNLATLVLAGLGVVGFVVLKYIDKIAALFRG